MNHNELLNSLRKGDKDVLKTFEPYPQMVARLRAIAMNPIPYKDGMARELQNGDGSINFTSAGFKFALQSTTLVLADVIRQRRFEQSIADFADVLVGRGANLEAIQQTITYDAGGPFHEGDALMGTKQQISNVDVASAPITYPLKGWVKGYGWSVDEVARALQTNNWDLIKSRQKALQSNWDQGIQEVGFVGNPQDQTNYPGLLSNTLVTANTTFFPTALSTMTASQLDVIVAGLIGLYRANCNESNSNGGYPNRLVIPTSDWTGLGVNVAIAGSPIAQTRLEYITKAFAGICGAGFKILATPYANKARNAGFWAAGGTNRYALYNMDPETIHMDIPVQLQILAPATGNNYQFNGVGKGQYSGMNIFRVPEVMYFDAADSL